MLFAVDIDQTVCGSNAYEIYAFFHNEDLNLGIDQETIAQLSSYRDFFFLPQVQTFRQAHEKEWNASRHRAIATPSVIAAFSPIPHAVQGIATLSSYGQVRYYTARTPLVQVATQQWLEYYSFAESQDVLCCSSIEQKLYALSCHQPQDEPIVLIDDRAHTFLLSALERLKEDPPIHQLLQRLRIVAFGITSLALPERTLCPIFVLPSWALIDTLLPLLLS